MYYLIILTSMFCDSEGVTCHGSTSGYTSFDTYEECMIEKEYALDIIDIPDTYAACLADPVLVTVN